MKVFTTTEEVFNRSVLGRMRNAFASAMNKNDKMPRFIIIAPEVDLLRCINFDKPGISIILGRCLQWLADEIYSEVTNRRLKLPARAVKAMYPQIFWVALPNHTNFSDNQRRFKFNQALQKIVPLYNGMKMLQLRRRWAFHDGSHKSTGRRWMKLLVSGRMGRENFLP